MKLIVVQGQTSTGKTTLVKRLTTDTGIPSISKDTYKEQVYSNQSQAANLLRWTKTERESWQVLYDGVRQAQQKSDKLIIEGNFQGNQRNALRKILGKGNAVVEVYCYAKPRVVFDRYVHRNKTGERHPGHWDTLWYGAVWVECVCARLGWKWVGPLKLSEAILMVDTTDFGGIDYQRIIDFIKAG
jgi:predicted kinase